MKAIPERLLNQHFLVMGLAVDFDAQHVHARRDVKLDRQVAGSRLEALASAFHLSARSVKNRQVHVGGGCQTQGKDEVASVGIRIYRKAFQRVGIYRRLAASVRFKQNRVRPGGLIVAAARADAQLVARAGNQVVDDVLGRGGRIDGYRYPRRSNHVAAPRDDVAGGSRHKAVGNRRRRYARLDADNRRREALGGTARAGDRGR